MKPELDQELCSKYPLIFRDRRASQQTTAMCWGFDCGDGWYNIIDRLCLCIQGYLDWNASSRGRLLESNPHNLPIPQEIEQVVALQVKEKFGTLRFYYSGGDSFIKGLVDMAESMSGVTCDVCGNPGKRVQGGWITTRCSSHE